MSDERDHDRNLSRRRFLAGAAALGVSLACSGTGPVNGSKALPRRKLGRTDLEISIVGMGGGSALGMVEDYERRLALVELARSRGINLFDSSANYGPDSEGCFGEALQKHGARSISAPNMNPNIHRMR